jgi:mono/diheme cytochrome c family protein
MITQTLRVAAAALICTLASSAFAQDGGEVFTASGCGACHGDAGRGAALGPSIATGELTAEDFIAYVQNPTATMPAYAAESLSDQSLREMQAYLESVGGAAQPVGDAERGAALFRQTGCYQCHANEGQGGAQGPRIGPDPLTQARFTWYIRNPSGGMPPYTDVVISDQDLADIHAFLKTRTQPAALEDIPLLVP